MTTAGQSSDVIVRALVDAITHVGPSQGLTGARAGAVVRAADPQFHPQKYGTASLRDFIRRYAPQIREIGSSGLDPVYGLAGWGRLGIEPGHDLWRIWVSPNSSLRLAFNKESGVPRQLQPDGQPDESETVVGPANGDIHRRIAREFLAEEADALPNDLQADLREIVERRTSTWWQEWMKLLAGAGDAARRWLAFRHDALRAELETALTEAALSPSAVDAGVSGVVATQRRPRSAQSRWLSEPSTAAGAHAHTLTSVVQSVVARMSEAELRALSLPVGLVVDALSERSSRP